MSLSNREIVLQVDMHAVGKLAHLVVRFLWPTELLPLLLRNLVLHDPVGNDHLHKGLVL